MRTILSFKKCVKNWRNLEKLKISHHSRRNLASSHKKKKYYNISFEELKHFPLKPNSITTATPSLRVRQAKRIHKQIYLAKIHKKEESEEKIAKKEKRESSEDKHVRMCLFHVMSK